MVFNAELLEISQDVHPGYRSSVVSALRWILNLVFKQSDRSEVGDFAKSCSQ